MYRMSTRSKIGRVLILPVFLLAWVTWIICFGSRILFECLENKLFRQMDKFNDWIDKYFPLG